MVVNTTPINPETLPYYVDKYFFSNPDCPGIYVGSGCAFLGLDGIATQRPHEMFLHGFSPEGTPLIRNAGPTEGWYGIDLTGNLDKSTSVLLATLLRERPADVMSLLTDSMRSVVAFLEERAAIVRFGEAGVERVSARICGAAFPQFENRNGECHAHVHLVVYRPAFAADGRVGALDQRSLFQPQLKMALGALFRAEAAFLSEKRFGMKTLRKGFGYEVEGIPANVVDAMSQRRRAIEAHLSEHGLSTARAAAYATLATREAKVHIPLPELLTRWESEFTKLGFGPEQAEGCLNRVCPYTDSIERRQEAALGIALEHSTKHQSYFSDLELIRRVAEEGQGRGLSAETVLQTVDHAIEHSTGIVRLGYSEEGRPVFTTPAIVALEKRLVTEAQAAQRDHSHIVRESTVRAVLSQHPELSEEKKVAVAYLTTRPGAVQITSGSAGTGKTSLLRVCREVWEKEGFSVCGATLTGKAAVGLQAEAGIPSDTIAMTLLRLREDAVLRARGCKPRVAIDEKTIFIVDEGATVGTRQLFELQHEVLSRGGKFILSGDPRQTQSIEFGGGMSGLAKRLGQVELSEIRRQRDPWARQAVKEFGVGNATAALGKYAARGLVIVTKNRTEALQAMVEDWSIQGIRAPEDNLMITATNIEAKRANQMAQAKRLHAGLLPDDRVEVDGRSLHLNDRVMILKNSRVLGVRNGELGTIVAVRPSDNLIAVKIDNGSQVLIPLKDFPHVSLGYALTAHKSQSITVPRVFCLVSENPNREVTVVQGSRHRDLCKFFVDQLTAGDNLSSLAKAMSRSKKQTLAQDIAVRDPSFVVLQPEVQR